MKLRFLILILVFSTVLVQAQSDKEQIMSILERQNNCWNAGDVECFMKGYWESDSLVYVGKKGLTYGYQNMLSHYKVAYPGKDAMGELTFTIKSLKPVGPDGYFMIGGWHLKRTIGDVGGHFTLLWRKMDDEWVIVADHSS